MKVILHNIRSVHNVGSMFRSADGAGIEKIYLSGFSPTPLDQFAQIRLDFHKTALGAEESVDWEKTEDVFGLIAQLKEGGEKIVAVEQSKESVLYKKTQLDSKNTVFIFGHEVKGLEPEILKAADQIIEIPMHGEKNSLNVSVAFGIILYHFND